MTVDWTDETLRSLDELARIAFPAGAGITAHTLKRRARQGKLVVYRPGKAYVASLAGVRAMIEATRVPAPARRGPSPSVPNSLGLTEMDLARMELDSALQELRGQVDEKKTASRDGARRGRVGTQV
jgi:hypothetical protein